VCETWSVVAREEHRLMLHEIKMLRRIFRTKCEEVAGGWRRQHDEDLGNLQASTDNITVKM
jgi:hypothetical protein